MENQKKPQQPFYVSGRIIGINLTTKKNPEDKFQTRTFYVDCSSMFNGEIMENKAGFQCLNKNCDILNDFNIGDIVDVYFSIKGNEVKKEDNQATEKNPNKVVVYTNLNCYRIVLVGKGEISLNLEKGDFDSTTNESTNKEAENNSKPTIRKKPDVIPEGYIWSVELNKFIEDDLPF